MGMHGSCIDLELAKDGTTEAVLGNHSVNGALNEQNRTALADHAGSLNFLAADPSGEAGVNLFALFVTAEADLVCIDHHDEIASVNVRGENWLVLTTEQACCFNCNLTENFVLSVNHIPLALDISRLGRKGLHVFVSVSGVANLRDRRPTRGRAVKLGRRYWGVNRKSPLNSKVFLEFPGSDDFCG